MYPVVAPSAPSLSELMNGGIFRACSSLIKKVRDGGALKLSLPFGCSAHMASWPMNTSVEPSGFRLDACASTLTPL